MIKNANVYALFGWEDSRMKLGNEWKEMIVVLVSFYWLEREERMGRLREGHYVCPTNFILFISHPIWKKIK